MITVKNYNEIDLSKYEQIVLDELKKDAYQTDWMITSIADQENVKFTLVDMNQPSNVINAEIEYDCSGLWFE